MLIAFNQCMDKADFLPYEGLILDYHQDDWGQIILEDHLGGDAYSDVFRGFEVGSRREITLKFFRNVESQFERQRVLNQCRVSLESEHILSLVSFQEWNPTTWILIFEDFPSQSVANIIENEGAFDLGDLKHYATQLIKGLHCAHKSDFPHGDIKPSNILISGHKRGSPGLLKVANFLGSWPKDFDFTDQPDEVLFGPRPYLSPEDFVSGPHHSNFDSDVFSFGIVVAEMLLGRHPWWNDYDGSLVDLYRSQLSKGQSNALPDADLPKDCKEIWELARHCTQFESKHRPRGWGEIAKRVGFELQTTKERLFSMSDASVILSDAPWYELPVDALVLSANNQLILDGATGLAGWLAEACPEMHDDVQYKLRTLELENGRGITFGNGLTIGNGPDGKSVIHAVTVDYDHKAVSKRYASVASVAAATEFAILEARRHNFESIGFALMCTRGHASEFLPNEMAKDQLPLIQLQTIFGMLAAPGNSNPKKVFITTHSPQNKELESRNTDLLATELDRLLNLYDSVKE